MGAPVVPGQRSPFELVILPRWMPDRRREFGWHQGLLPKLGSRPFGHARSPVRMGVLADPRAADTPFLAGRRQVPPLDVTDHLSGRPTSPRTEWRAQAHRRHPRGSVHARSGDSMTASSTAAARFPQSLPRLRSSGGSDAGSSDQPGRRNPHAASPIADVDVAEFLAAAQSALTAQRTFRIQQLQQLDSLPPDLVTDPARAEIHRALLTAARSALRDIEVALRRIERGSYGRCFRCGDTISAHWLRALPTAALCGRCAGATARCAVTEPGQPATGSSPSRDPVSPGTTSRLRRRSVVPNPFEHGTSELLRGEHHREHSTGE